MNRWGIVFSLALLITGGTASLLAPGGVAHAQSANEDQARMHFRAGQSLTQQNRFEEALREFRAGFELTGRPLFLFNMAECAKELGQLESARRNYQLYIERDPDGPMAATARQRLNELAPAQPPPQVRPEPAPVARPEPAPVTRPVETAPVARPAQPAPRPVVESPVAEGPVVESGAPTPAEVAAQSSSEDSDLLGASTTQRDEVDDDGGTIFEAWPFWVAVGGVVAAGTVTAIMLSRDTESGPVCGMGCSLVDFR